MVFDGDVPALDIADLFEALSERGKGSLVSGSISKEPDYRHHLLRARGERPSRRRTAEKRNELTSPHILTQAQATALYRLKRVL
ncbi:MAG: hypothetical protein WAN75_35365 [Xanthobacteraceae bacterium]